MSSNSWSDVARLYKSLCVLLGSFRHLLCVLCAHASGWPVQIYLIIYELASLLNPADTGQCINVRHTI